MNRELELAGGRNIAMKVPPRQWEATVRFYRDVVKLDLIEHPPTVPPSVGFKFGPNQLWIDRVETVSQAEIWLELTASDVPAASEYLRAEGIDRCDEIEALPADADAFWIASPASIVHLVSKADQ
jgi:hypothetical protein